MPSFMSIRDLPEEPGLGKPLQRPLPTPVEAPKEKWLPVPGSPGVEKSSVDGRLRTNVPKNEAAKFGPVCYQGKQDEKALATNWIVQASNADLMGYAARQREFTQEYSLCDYAAVELLAQVAYAEQAVKEMHNSWPSNPSSPTEPTSAHAKSQRSSTSLLNALVDSGHTLSSARDAAKSGEGSSSKAQDTPRSNIAPASATATDGSPAARLGWTTLEGLR